MKLSRKANTTDSEKIDLIARFIEVLSPKRSHAGLGDEKKNLFVVYRNNLLFSCQRLDTNKLRFMVIL